MRWFKHLTQSSQDEKIMRVEERFGIEGYGAYFKILELIGAQLSPENEQTFVTFSLKTWRKVLGFPPKKLKNFADFSEKVGLFISKLEGDELTIDCPNILKYKDEWQRKGKNKEAKTPESVRSDSGAAPDSVLESESKKESESDKTLVPTVLGETEVSPPPEAQEDSSEKLDTKTATVEQVPYQKILDLYHKILTHLPSVNKLTVARKSHIRARWKNDLLDLAAWEQYFRIVSKSAFLMGRVPPIPPRTKAFLADLDWLVNESNAVKVCEGRYHV